MESRRRQKKTSFNEKLVNGESKRKAEEEKSEGRVFCEGE